ncbi:MAG: nickel-dependent lactate racemase [Spirochaetales bacterium]|nr:nickel-dependent lactate racemase [Spirochaetales bacterium]
MEIQNPVSRNLPPLVLPEGTAVLSMKEDRALPDAETEVRKALEHPIGSDSLLDVALSKKKANARATACILVSDNTRPVPYKGGTGILMPIVRTLLQAGYGKDEILVLVATGMHKPMSEGELRAILDEEVFNLGLRIENHEPSNPDLLTFVGKTSRGTRAVIDSRYMKADLKIATGLVESHFMAGASGGRKAICPGIIGEESTYVFHGPELMAHPMATDLVIDGNPVHEESLAVAKLAGMDFLVNVTLNGNFEITGVFAGDMELAHRAAVAKIRDAVSIDIDRKYDIVVTHGGYVGINHYQTAKCAVAAMGALKKGGYLVVISDLKDRKGIVGSPNYRTTLALLHLLGPERFLDLITSKDWTFLPEQWQVQQWAKVFSLIGEDHMYYYAPQLGDEDFSLLPGRNAGSLQGVTGFREAVCAAIEDVKRRTNMQNPAICYLSDGPYAIPVLI